MMPKAHPNSNDPGFEWRVSFSLVEKRILGKINYLFRKVYLICKKITVIRKWKKQYNFPSYILKTAFLWTLEKKWKEDTIFDNIRIITHEGDTENRHVTPFFSFAFQALAV